MEAQSLFIRTIDNIRARSGLIVLSVFMLIDFYIYHGISAKSQSGNPKGRKHNTQIISFLQNDIFYVWVTIPGFKKVLWLLTSDSPPPFIFHLINPRVWKIVYSHWLKFILILLFFLLLQIKCQYKAAKFSNLG